MFDTVHLRLTQNEENGVNFLEEIPCFLNDVCEYNYKGFQFISGDADGLKVTANRFQVTVKNSLCKYLLGNNYQTMGRKDTQRAFEKLSDTLHLPMEKAVVTRLDVAQNFILKYPPEAYLNHLGVLKFAKRLQEPDGLYYDLNGGRLCFYDKNKEQKSKRGEIPELYNSRNVLRYERRFTRRTAAQFDVKEIAGEMLYNEAFYIEAINKWKAGYKDIQKINDVTINFQAMKTKQQLYKMGILALIEQAGGQLELINQITDAQRRGELSKKQAYDLRTTVTEAANMNDGLTTPNGVILELTKKVAEAAQFYR